MKILFCCADAGVALLGNGGASVHVRSLATALADRGHRVRLVASNVSGPAAFSLPVAHVPARRLWPGLSRGIERLRGGSGGSPAPVLPVLPAPAGAPERASWKVRAYYQWLPRQVDAFEEFVTHPFAFARAAAREIEIFKPDAVYERYALGQFGAALATGALGASQSFRVPHVLEINAPLAGERREPGWWGKMSEKGLWQAPDRVFCVSERLGELALRAGVRPRALRVTPNGVDTRAFSPARPRGALRRMLPADPRELLIGWLGALSPGRGAEEFVRIMALVLPENPGARAVVIGSGPLLGDLKNLAARLDIASRVTFAGPVDHARVPLVLVDLDVAVACYPGQEGFYFSPMKLAEYFACGLAVVAGRAGEVARTATDGVHAALCAPGDLAGFARAVSELCRDAKKRRKLGIMARAAALAGPTWEKTACEVERQMETVISDAGGKRSPVRPSETSVIADLARGLQSMVAKSGDVWSFYDLTSRAYRLRGWRWDTGIVLEALAAAAAHTNDASFLASARIIGDRLVAAQLKPSAHPKCPGGFPEWADVRYWLPSLRFGRWPRQWPRCWVVPFNAAFIAAGLARLADAAGEDAYRQAARDGMRLAAGQGMTAAGGVFGYYFEDAKTWNYLGQINDSGIIGRGFALFPDVEWAREGAARASGYILSKASKPGGHVARAWWDASLAAAPHDPLFPEWRRDPGRVVPKIFLRGQAWTLLGLTGAVRLGAPPESFENARRLAAYIVSVQRPDGSWLYSGLQPELGVCAKTTAALSLALAEWSRASGDASPLGAAHRALGFLESCRRPSDTPADLAMLPVDPSPEGCIIYRRARPVVCAYGAALELLARLALEGAGA